MEYSERLKKIVLNQKHVFVYGEEKERIKYLQSLVECYKNDERQIKPVVIYTNNEGLRDCQEEFDEKERIRAMCLQQEYFEFVITSLIIEKLSKVLTDKERDVLERILPMLLNADIQSLDGAQKALLSSQEISKEIYNSFIKTGEINQKLIAAMEIGNIFMESLLAEIKETIPSISDFAIIINKTSSFGTIYRRVINTYIDEREQSLFSIKVGCQNIRDWGDFGTINGRFIQDTHAYSYVFMDDYKLQRTKKEQ